MFYPKSTPKTQKEPIRGGIGLFGGLGVGLGLQLGNAPLQPVNPVAQHYSLSVARLIERKLVLFAIIQLVG